ncbi:MAG: hypothetical protein V4727_11290 [Verrucomicrobiota bacterium]
MNPTIATFLVFDASKIFAGEVWRLVTFLFADGAMIRQDAPQTLFLFIMVMLSFMMSNALEDAWGVFRTSMFMYTGWFCLIIANFICLVPFGGGKLLFASSFFAFATLFPRAEFLMMFIIPVQARWLAILSALYLIFNIFKFPLIIAILLMGFHVIAFVNYFLWAGIPALRGQARVYQAVQRRRKFQKDSSRDGDAFHRCSSCDRTDLSDPELEFRMSVDGKEYCTDHLKD